MSLEFEPEHEEETRRLESRLRPNLPRFVTYHREKAMDALKSKRICKNCDAEDCHLKCAKCKGVSYCNRDCQVTDWPKHKKICKIYQHVSKHLLSMQQEALEDFMFHGHEVFGAILLMAGIEATVIFFVAVDWAMKPMPLVLADGRLYDVQSPLTRREFPLSSLLNREKIQPLPPPEEVEKNHFLTTTLMQQQVRSLKHPWRLPDNIENDDRNRLLRLSCRILINCHYVECGDKETILKLYGKYDTIKEAMGESTEEFKKRMDDMYCLHGSPIQVLLKLDEQFKTSVRQMPLKDETRLKLIIDQVATTGGLFRS